MAAPVVVAPAPQAAESSLFDRLHAEGRPRIEVGGVEAHTGARFARYATAKAVDDAPQACRRSSSGSDERPAKWSWWLCRRPRGGVGKTTLVANLAVALRRRGRQVTAIDFDSQNALRFLLAPEYEDDFGIARCTARGLPWTSAVVAGRDGVRVAPYGEATTSERLRMKDLLDEDALSEALSSLMRSEGEIIIADTTPGEGRLQQRLETLADLKLIVLLAETPAPWPWCPPIATACC
ncbi:cellulose synthase operon protein YhjQ/BcsQ [Caulobacter segnis]